MNQEKIERLKQALQNSLDAVAEHRTVERQQCWYGGTCENLAVYQVVGQRAGWDEEHMMTCVGHLQPVIQYHLRRVAGWPAALPCRVELLNPACNDLILSEESFTARELYDRETRGTLDVEGRVRS